MQADARTDLAFSAGGHRHCPAAPFSVELPEELKPGFGLRPVVGSHRLHEHPLFTDAALIDLLDNFPRQQLYALSMGSDPTRIEENRLAVHDGVSGADLLRAVRKGRFWLNATRVDRVDARYRRLISTLYAELSAQLPGFRPDASQGALLISSPRAVVYLHADAPAQALWHLRGRKRVWVYPALDPRFMQQEFLEDIFDGVRHEYLHYEPGHDAAAQVFDLEPGQWIVWPHNAPHRVTNLDSVNVSLSTEHFTRASRRRHQLYVANRFFRRRLGWKNLSPREDGARALLKIAVQRSVRMLGLNPVQFKRHIPVLRVAPDAPGGVVALTAGPAA